MPRPRLPTAIQKLTGADKANVTRWNKQNRDNEPAVRGPIPLQPPKHFSQLQAECYLEVCERCHKDVLCDADIVIVELTAILIAKMRSKADLSVANMGKLITCLNTLGMTPASRSKVQAIKRDDLKKHEEPIDDFGDAPEGSTH